MKVTIVTPCLNGAAFLGATMDSIAAQTHADIQHIVIDGDSTDGSQDIVRSYPHATLVVAKDGGMYEAVNRGLAMAQGDVLAYLNSDDLYFPDSVERAVAAFTADPGTELVFSDLDLIDADGRTLYVRRFLPYRRDLFVSVDHSTMPQPTAFWRADLYRRVGPFDTRYRLAGDFEFFIRACAAARRVRHLGRPLARFRIHGAALSQTRQAEMTSEVRRVLDQHGVARSLGRRLRGAAYQAALRALNLPGLVAGRR